MLCRYVMNFQFLDMEKSRKVIVEKEWAPCIRYNLWTTYCFIFYHFTMIIAFKIDIVVVTCV